MKNILIIGFFLVIPIVTNAQSQLENFLKPSDTLNYARRNTVIITESSIFTLSLIGLNQLWYKNYEQSSFHTLDDSGEWLQVDKIGHVYSAYQLGKLGANVLKWSGVKKKDQLLYGATLGLGFLTVVEVFDGFSKEWGFSWSDMASNAAGAGLYIGQNLIWHDQRISLKYSFHQTSYAQTRPETLGNGFLEEFIKDYNGQTYWLSANIKSFFKNSKIPAWLNVAVGYGAEGMLTGDNETINGMFIEQDRRRQYFLSMDIDFSRIKTNSHFLRTLFDVVNTLKVPFPALEFTEDNGIKVHGIYF